MEGGGLLSKRVGSMEGGLAAVEAGGRGGRGGRSLLERYSDDDEDGGGSGGRGRAEEEKPFSERVSSEAAELREEERCSTGPTYVGRNILGNH